MVVKGLTLKIQNNNVNTIVHKIGQLSYPYLKKKIRHLNKNILLFLFFYAGNYCVLIITAFFFICFFFTSTRRCHKNYKSTFV